MVEFTNSNEYNVYRGNTSGNVDYLDVYANLEFINSTMTINVGLPEVSEGKLKLSIDEFPIVYTLQ